MNQIHCIFYQLKELTKATKSFKHYTTYYKPMLSIETPYPLCLHTFKSEN